MRAEEYQRLFELEGSYWWFVGLHELVSRILLSAVLKTGPTGRALDAGCGTGKMLTCLSAFQTAIGVDRSPIALARALRRLQNSALSGNVCSLVQSSVTKLPFNSETFDVVISLDVLYHQWVQDDVEALKEFRRVLKPQGMCIINLPAFEWLRGSHDIAVQTRERYTISKLRKRLLQAGFQIEFLAYRNIVLFPLLLIRRIISRIFKRSDSDVKPLHPALNALFLTFLRFENIILTFCWKNRFPTLPLAGLPGSSVFVIARKGTNEVLC
ncbi:MAG: methyltransferase domain-containing protein [Bacteroidota bacterium]